MVDEDHVWCVRLDGSVTHHGLTRSDAERFAKYLQEGLDRKRANDKKRTGEITIARDHQALAKQDRLYHRLKSHTTVGYQGG